MYADEIVDVLRDYLGISKSKKGWKPRGGAVKTGVAAVVIAKDEEAVIKRCVKSLRDLDQVVVVDTGSSDATAHMARKAGAAVFKGEMAPPFHFAAARNAAMAEAACPWILSVDADEALRAGSVGRIRRALMENPDTHAYEVSFQEQSADGRSFLPDKKVRLFRKDRFRWQYRIHEIPVRSDPEARIGKLPDCWIEHFPKRDKTARRRQNLELLELAVTENPEYMQLWKQLGLERLLTENWTGAAEALAVYARNPYTFLVHEDAAAYMLLGQALARAGRKPEAWDAFEEASRKAPRRREPPYWAGLEFLRAGEPWNAVPWLKRALERPAEDLPEFSLFSAAAQGTLIEETLAETEAMIERAKKAHAGRSR